MIYIKEYVAKSVAKTDAEIVSECNVKIADEVALGEAREFTEADIVAAKKSVAFEAKTNPLREVAKKLCTEKNMKTFDAVINDIMREAITTEEQITKLLGA